MLNKYYTRKIYLRLAGGLGNQLFQITAAYVLAQRLQIPIVTIDPRFLFRYGSVRNLECDFFLRHLAGVLFDRVPSGYLAALSRARAARFYEGAVRSVYLVASNTGLASIKANDEQSILMDGYFQDPTLLFSDKDRLSIHNKLIIEHQDKIDRFIYPDRRVIGVHIRRGDYLKGRAAKIYRSLDLDYYRRAINRCQNGTQTILVFSDDPEISASFSAETGGVDMRSQRLTLQDELIILSCCDDLIIANSTFSWWAAYLGFRSSKHVICPRDWFHRENHNRENKLLLPYFDLI